MRAYGSPMPDAVAAQQTSGRRWVVLAVGVLAQTSACAFVYGVPFLVPDLRDTLHLSLPAVGTYVAAPTAGLLLTLIAWGAAADRFGERKVMASGLLLAALAVGATLVLLTFALGDAVAPWLAVAALAVGGIVTVADNGLAFTAVAEIAGAAWSGRALGVQNTGQNVVSSLTPIALGAVVAAAGYAVGFVVAAAAPLAAIALTPVRDEPEPSW